MNHNPDQSGLIHWVKGQSGNPDGKKKGTRNLSTILKEYLELEVEIENEKGEKVKVENQDLIIAQLIRKAAKDGDLKAIEQILDRMEGKPIQKQEIKTDNPILTIQREIIDGNSKPGNTTDVHPAAD